MKLPPVGAFSFSALRAENKYYVDKTPFIKTVVQYNAKVLLITRPRRFGKSLFMDTVFRFLAVDSNNPGNSEANAKLFSGLKILEDQEFCDAYMGQYPVISLTLKDVKDNNFTSAYIDFANAIADKASKFKYLLDSPRLDEEEKETFANYTKRDFLRKLENKDYIKDFLKDMISFLGKHFQRQVIVLIDEYDVPLDKAARFGYYDEMLPIIQGFLGKALKPDLENAGYLKKAILMGCLRVGKQSISTGFNNLDANTVCSQDLSLSEAIGFTTSEVKELLHYYGLDSRFLDIQRWYDGYRFAKSKIYCPWDLINFCDKAITSDSSETYELENYWIGTSGNDVVDEFLGFLSGEETEKMQTLVDGGEIEVTINETLNYIDLKNHNPQDFWTLLLFAGYLTIAERLPQSALTFKLRIPNEEVRDTFIKKVHTRFSTTNTSFVNRGLEFVRATFVGDVDKITDALSSVLDGYVSIRDMATKVPHENYYHGMLNALCACGSGSLEFFNSNAESGNGYADIVFTDKIISNRTGVVIEIKYATKQEDLYDAAQSALNQIREKNYGAYLEKFRCKKQRAYGIAFSGKSCVVLCDEK